VAVRHRTEATAAGHADGVPSACGRKSTKNSRQSGTDSGMVGVKPSQGLGRRLREIENLSRRNILEKNFDATSKSAFRQSV